MSGTWRAIANQPSVNIERMLLLTDGTVFCHLGNERWSLFHPDNRGQYLNGFWTAADSMHHARRNFGATVLANGKVLVAFGWPNISTTGSGTWNGDQTIEIFTPGERAGRQWRLSSANPGWDAAHMGQTHICALADGHRVLVGTDIFNGPAGDFGMGRQSSLYNIVTNSWQLVDPGFETGSDLQAWTLLPDGSIISTNGFPQDFRFIPDTVVGRWVTAGNGAYSGDVYLPFEGQGLLLPDGRIWVVSKVDGETVFYHPPAIAGDPGRWTTGPVFPNITDGYRPETSRLAACLLPSGKVLCAVNSFDDSAPVFYEFDPLDGEGSIQQVNQPEYLSITSNLADQGAVLILLPTGEVMMGYNGQLFIYTPDADSRPPLAAWRPHLSSPTDMLVPDGEYIARGSLFNGMSQAVCHNPWKSAGTATNFPIIRLCNIASGTVRYLGTYNHSSFGVATGSTSQITHFRVAPDFMEGEADLSVIANGIESERIRLVVRQGIMRIIIPKEFNKLIGNLADGPLFVLGPHGLKPVPPFGPGDGVFKKQFTERIAKAYEHLLSGLLYFNATSGLDGMLSVSSSKAQSGQSIGIRQIQYGLALLRKLGVEADNHFRENKSVQIKLETEHIPG